MTTTASARPAPQNGNGAKTAAAPTLPKVSRLSQAKKGKVNKPPRICIYGAKKIGKTTLTAHAPEPLFLDLNRGSEYMNVTRFPFRPGQPNETVPETFDELMGGLYEIRDSPSDHRTLVVDLLSEVEGLIWRHILAQDSGVESENNKRGKVLTSIEDYGYAKGYQIAVDRGWIPFLNVLDEIRDRRGMTIILVEHSSISEYKNPTGDDYHRHVMKVHKHAAAAIAGWVDVLAFYTFDDVASKRPGAKRAQGVFAGGRVLHVDHDAVWEGGSRIPLPSRIEVAADDPWRPFAEAIAEGQAMPRAHVLADIDAELARLGDPDLATRTRAWTEERDVDQLWRCLVGLRQRVTTPNTAAAAPQEG